MPAAPANSFDALIRSPFVRLRDLLRDVEPGAEVVNLALGEPRHAMPDFVAETLHAHAKDYARYPLIKGTTRLREAIGIWLERRYPKLVGKIDEARHILPLNGSREGLFSVLFPLLDRWRARHEDNTQPAVLIPNPFYQAYAAAAYAAHAEPVFLPTDATSGFLPDLDRLANSPDLLARTAAFYLCSPANPQGAVADATYLQEAVRLAQQHGFVLLVDECYSEIYHQSPPPGALETALETSGSFANVISFQSLSKRSNLPGLRSGFCAGDAELMGAFERFRNVACPQMPLPTQYASAKVWLDEEHVIASRAQYAEKFADAEALMAGLPGFRLPDAAFFLWLDVSHMGGGEKAARLLFERAGVRVLPGRYLSHTDPAGHSPGDDFVRIALVDERKKTRGALQRITDTFT